MATATQRREEGAPGYKIPFSAPAWDKCFEALHAVRQLRDDWDAAGAVAPAGEVTDAAEEILRFFRRWLHVPAPSRLAAGPNGTILLEWQNGLNYFEMEVCDPTTVEWMMAVPNKKPEHGVGVDRLTLDRLSVAISL